jgi:hypothetical protein
MIEHVVLLYNLLTSYRVIQDLALVNRSTGYYVRPMTRPDLCLDFANTRYWRGQEMPTETLNAPADLAAWA